MAKYAGRKSLLYMSTTGTAAATAFLNLTNWSINAATDKFETTSFGDANKTYVQGLKDIQGAFQGFYDDSASANLFTAADSSDGVKLYLYPSSDAITKYAYGPAWVDASIQTEVGGVVRINGSFASNGSWGFNKL